MPQKATSRDLQCIYRHGPNGIFNYFPPERTEKSSLLYSFGHLFHAGRPVRKAVCLSTVTGSAGFSPVRELGNNTYNY
jgi:hypothetical protein